MYTDYIQEQEMEIEALEAILMDDFKGMRYFYRPAFVMIFFFSCCPAYQTLTFNRNFLFCCFSLYQKFTRVRVG